MLSSPSALSSPAVMSATATVPRHWRLHLGAHKTASTHIQQVLENLAPQLQKAGTDYVTHRTLLSQRIPDLRLRNPRAWIGGAALRKQMMTQLKPHLSGANCLLMSCEDWFGASQEGLAPNPYPKMSRRFGAFMSAIPKRSKISLFMSVRNWADYIPSAYATALRFGVQPHSTAQLRQQVMARIPDWTDLVTRIQAAAPHAELTIWPFETYRANSAQIISHMTGQFFDQLPQIADPIATRTPSHSAIEQIERLDDMLSPSERQARVKAIWEGSRPERDGKFQMFTAQDKADLTAAYAQQLQALSKRKGIDLMSFVKKPEPDINLKAPTNLAA